MQSSQLDTIKSYIIINSSHSIIIRDSRFNLFFSQMNRVVRF